MTDQQYARGAVVKGPDLLGADDYRPYVCLSTENPPFRDEEVSMPRLQRHPARQRSHSLSQTSGAAAFPVRVSCIRGSSSRSNTLIYKRSRGNSWKRLLRKSHERRPLISERWTDTATQSPTSSVVADQFANVNSVSRRIIGAISIAGFSFQNQSFSTE